MKNISAFLILIFLFTATAVSAADLEVTREGRSDLSPFRRSGSVFVRGITNVLTSPLEAVRTFKVERQWHPKAWPVSYIPRTLYNFLIRVSSGAYDMAFMPFFVVPFTDDIRPFTHVYDLPDYPWQILSEE